MKNTSKIVKMKEESLFAKIPNAMLQDKNLGLAAKGLLSFLLSLPEDWVVYKSNIHEHFSCSRDAIRTAWDELEKNRYIVSKRMTDPDTGRLGGWHHTISYKPIEPSDDLSDTGNTDIGITDIGIPYLGEVPPIQRNSKQINIEQRNINTNKYKYKDFVCFLNSQTGKDFKGDTVSEKNFNARIQEGRTQEEFETAVRNACADKYHIDSALKHITPEFICRADKLDKFCQMTPAYTRHVPAAHDKW